MKVKKTWYSKCLKSQAGYYNYAYSLTYPLDPQSQHGQQSLSSPYKHPPNLKTQHTVYYLMRIKEKNPSFCCVYVFQVALTYPEK